MRLQRGGEHHVLKLILVGGGHADDQRQAAQVRDVEEPVVGRTVVGAQARAIHAEDHGQVLQADVVVDTVVSPLQEGAVNGHHRMKTHGRHASGENHGVFFSDADVVVLAGNGLLQDLEAGSAGHGRGDADDGFVLLAQLDHGATKDLLPHGGGVSLRRRSLAGRGIVSPQSMKLLGMLQRRLVALALLREHVDDHRLIASLGELEGADQQRNVVTVNRSQIAQSEFFEQQRAAVTTAAVDIQWIIGRLQSQRTDNPLERLFGLAAQHGDLLTPG